MPYNEKTKLSAYKWRELNKAKYNEYCNIKALEYYNNNRDIISERKKLRYLYKQECIRLRNILL